MRTAHNILDVQTLNAGFEMPVAVIANRRFSKTEPHVVVLKLL